MPESYQEEEIIDINTIRVTIPDQHTPIVVLFGGPCMGKTLVLFRMIRWFESHGMIALPERVFRPQYDRHYQHMCESLHTMVYAPSYQHGSIGFMLVKILDKYGNPVCLILKVPGEHCFYPHNPACSFPLYLQQIVQAPNRKVSVVFFCEKDWADQQTRNRYADAVKRIQNLMMNLGKRGKAVFLFNKADQQPHFFDSAGKPVFKHFFEEIYYQYPGIFDKYERHGLKRIFCGRYGFKALCFSVGTLMQLEDGSYEWMQGKDLYCEQFWKAIK